MYRSLDHMYIDVASLIRSDFYVLQHPYPCRHSNYGYGDARPKAGGTLLNNGAMFA
jgi:hypothetical protein